MTWMHFVSIILPSLTWPIVAIVIYLGMRKEIKELLRSLKITKIKASGVELEFENDLHAAQQELKAPNLAGKLPDLPVPEKSLKLLETNPNYAILEAWKEVEASIIELSSTKYGTPRNFSFRRHLLELVKKDVVPPEVFEAIEELNRARNRIVHEQNFRVEKKTATRYVDLLSDIAGFVNQLF